MLRDAEYFKTRIGSLDGASNAGDYIVNLVKEKHVPKAVAAAVVPDATTPVTANGKTSSDSTSESKKEEEQDKDVECKEKTEVESEKA